MTEEYCGGCDRFVPVSASDIRRIDHGDIQFRCRDCRTMNTNRIPIIRREAS